MAGMDAAEARVMIWEALRKVARPDSRFSWEFSEFITDYEGSDASAELLAQQPFYRDAKVVFITPDNNLEELRKHALLDQKTVVMTNYGITRGFFLLTPGSVPAGKEELASVLDGVSRYWKHQTLAQLKQNVGRIDLMVTGASAITPGGTPFRQRARLLRFGVGHDLYRRGWWIPIRPSSP